MISSSLFGALAGSEALPFTREEYEESIRASGRGVEPSLAAFAAGFEAARSRVRTRRTPPPRPKPSPPVRSTRSRPTPRPAASMDATSDPIELSVVPGGTARRSTRRRWTRRRPSSRRAEERKTKRSAAQRAAAPTRRSLVGPGLRDLAEQVRDLPPAAAR